MRKTPVIVIINKKPYTLDVNNADILASMPDEDRQQLIQILEVIKNQEHSRQASTGTVAETLLKTKPVTPNSTNTFSSQSNNLDRLHSGDADAVMAQLIMEEELNKKPATSKLSIHKWMIIVAIVVILLVLVL